MNDLAMKRVKRLTRLQRFSPIAIFLALFIIMTIVSPTFLQRASVMNLLKQCAVYGILAIGETFVIMTGGIDLSVGSVMAVGSSLTAVLMTSYGLHWALAALISVAAGCLMGAFSGFLVAYMRFQGFVASLSVMTIARGIAYTITNATPINLPDGTLNSLTFKAYGYPIIWITLFLVILLSVVSRYTSYGRIIVATGSNAEAVKLSGIRVRRYILSVYVISGSLAALAGVFLAARSGVGNSTIAEGQELDAIASCVIGGASLAGGKGSIMRTVIGALILALIGNIMNLMAIPAYPQKIIKGLIIIAAVLLQVLTDKRKHN